MFVQNWSDEAQQDQTSCMILVICMHYFYLTNFFWMLVEGKEPLYLFNMFTRLYQKEANDFRV